MGEAAIVSESTCIITNPMLVEMSALMDILVRSAMETRNLLLKTGREEILFTKGAKTVLSLCSSILWKVELVSNETGYLAEEISKKNVEGMAWFLLTPPSQ